MSLSLYIIISLITIRILGVFFSEKTITPSPLFKLNSRSLETCEAGTDPASGMRGGMGGPL